MDALEAAIDTSAATSLIRSTVVSFDSTSLPTDEDSPARRAHSQPLNGAVSAPDAVDGPSEDESRALDSALDELNQQVRARCCSRLETSES